MTHLFCSGCHRQFVTGEVIFGVPSLRSPAYYICSKDTLPSEYETALRQKCGGGFYCSKCFLKLGGEILVPLAHPPHIHADNNPRD
jgi:hypothetical protein